MVDALVQSLLFSDTPLGSTCMPEDPESAPPRQEITEGMVMTAAADLTWSRPTLIIQPPGGETLVNFPTVFHSTTSQRQTQRVTLLGQEIDIQAWPSRYVWRHGDGTSQTTPHPGAPVTGIGVNLRNKVHHSYTAKNTVTVSVTAIYSGRFRIAGGEWQQLSGTLSVPGESRQLTIRTARPLLVR